MTKNTVTIVLSTQDLLDLNYAATNARQEVRADNRTDAFWNGIVAAHGTGKGKDGQPKRADIVKAVLEAMGAWRDDMPQNGPDKKRTEFGNVVLKFGARFDAAVRRATGEEPKKPDYLALAVQAAGTAHNKGEHDVETILNAIRASLMGDDKK